MSSRPGATREEWAFWSGRHSVFATEVLPTVCNLTARVASNKKAGWTAKVPSRYYRDMSGAWCAQGIVEWQSLAIRQENFETLLRHPLAHDYGICLRTRLFPAFDIDVEDAALADEIEAAIVRALGIQPPARVRINSAKRLLLCALETPDDLAGDELLAYGPFTKKKIKFAALNADGKPAALEVLGAGQQCVVAGTHPSGARYEWRDGLPTSLPIVPFAALETFKVAA